MEILKKHVVDKGNSTIIINKLKQKSDKIKSLFGKSYEIHINVAKLRLLLMKCKGIEFGHINERTFRPKQKVKIKKNKTALLLKKNTFDIGEN